MSEDSPPRPRAARRVAAVLGALLLLAAGAAALLALRLSRWVRAPFGAAGERVVEIPPGATIAEVAQGLAGEGVVSDGERFFLYERLRHAGRKLKHGEYGFTLPMSPEQVLDHLLSGKVKTYKVTVPEGLRMDQIAPLFAEVGVASGVALLSAMKDAGLMKKLGVPAVNAEGFLFPDTYVLPKGRAPAQIVAEMVAHFRGAYEKARAEPGADLSLGELRTVTLASIIEKETGAPAERPRISCVFRNRLRRGMKLQTDPTVIYAMLLAEGHFDGDLTKKMLLTPHPYNTYTVYGLPPGPIANPGLAALEAAFHPAPCRDLYFVAKGDGTHAFCPTLVCHNQNVERYQIAPFERAHARR